MGRGARKRRRQRREHLQQPWKIQFFKFLNWFSKLLFGRNIFARWVYERQPKGTLPNPSYKERT